MERSEVCSIKLSQSGHCLSWNWQVEPSSKMAGSMIVKLYRQNKLDGTPVLIEDDNLLAVKLWMPSMGHGSVPTKTSKMDVGTYQIENVFFIMPGDWEIRFQITKDDVVVDEVSYKISI